MVKTKYYILTNNDKDVIALVRATSKTNAIKKYIKQSGFPETVQQFYDHFEIDQHKVL